ncbi:MAG TPA: PfkB family carbohydrate kinase, partial [Longimicrobiales bacterium]|nr:PfkB family carbohydrate kinase [Longimicrobiales bacterium]
MRSHKFRAPGSLWPMISPSSERLISILERMRRVRALVVGDVMLDTYLRGAVSRVSPEAPVPIVHVTEEFHAPGGAANVAANVAALGATCDLVGLIGRDLAGLELEQLLGRMGIASDGLLRTDDRPTTVKTRVMAGHHQVARYDRESVDDVNAAVAAELVALIERFAAT